MEEDSIRVRIKKARLVLGMSSKEVAEEIGVSPVTYSRYETGKRTPTIKHFFELSNVFNCTIDYFLHIEGEYFEIERKMRDLRAYLFLKENLINDIRKYLSSLRSDDKMEKEMANSYLEYVKKEYDQMKEYRNEWLDIIDFGTIDDIIKDLKNENL